MTIDAQLCSFLAFGIYGLILGIGYELLLKNSTIKTYFWTIISSFIFSYIIYKVNGGIIHPYFYMVLIVMIFLSKVSVNLVKKHFKLLRRHLKE